MGEGYQAITAGQGLELITRGNNAYRALRSAGQYNIWCCRMGRAAQDGTFDEFQMLVPGLEMHCDGLPLRAPGRRDGGFQREGVAGGER